MGLFRRSRHDHSNNEPEPASRVTVSDTDWADPEVVRVEWRDDHEKPDWGGAMELFDEGPIPAQQLNVAEYFTRKLKLALFDRSALPDELTAEVCRRVLVLLSHVPTDPPWVSETHWKFGPRLIRLPLAIMRDRNWQPVQYGGDGTVDVDLNVGPVVSAVATTRAPHGQYLHYFFGSA